MSRPLNLFGILVGKINERIMKTSDFDYNLPKKFIAQSPVSSRDASRLMIYDSSRNAVFHEHFYDLDKFLRSGDILVLNRSKVIPARILFQVEGKEREVFLLKDLDNFTFQVLVRPGNFFKLGKKFFLSNDVFGEVLEVAEDGTRIIRFNSNVEKFGEMPLPPYIKNRTVDFSRYQTIYAKEKGSVAAPTAGLHFTEDLFTKLSLKGIQKEEIILHIGLGTFLPVSSDNVADHVMHEEYFEISAGVCGRLNDAKKEGRRIIAVGTTSVRVLESSYDRKESSKYGFLPKKQETNIFIYPGNYSWKVVDGLITNFHLPKSTLIMLVASFLEHKKVKEPVEKILWLYELAKKNNYRFYSFGDAMLII